CSGETDESLLLPPHLRALSSLSPLQPVLDCDSEQRGSRQILAALAAALLSRHPFADVGRTVSELDATAFGAYQECHGITVGQFDLGEVESDDTANCRRPDPRHVLRRFIASRTARAQMKASALFGAGWEDDSLEVLWRDTGRVFCRLWRDDSAGQTHAFIPVNSAVAPSSLARVNRLTHEYGLQRYLDSAWALRPLELVRERGQTMLVVDYTGGEPLDRLVRQPMEIGAFLRIATALSGAVGQLHGCGLIHKDLKPANVLVDSATGRVQLAGFGIASR